MNYYHLFYLLSMADSVKQFFDTASNIFTVLCVISFFFYIVMTFIYQSERSKVRNIEDADKDSDVISCYNTLKWARNLSWAFLGLSLVTWFGYMACPSKKDALLIVAGGATVTYLANDSLAKQLPSEALGFVTSELKSMAAEAKVELKAFTAKDKFLDEIKSMSSEQVLAKMKTDTSFARLYLEYTK